MLGFHTGVKDKEGAMGHRAKIRFTGDLISQHVGEVHLKEGAHIATGRKEPCYLSGQISDLVIVCIAWVLSSNFSAHEIVISCFK